jgi:hypothetical protein
MKLSIFLLPVFFLTVSADGCHRKGKNNNTGIYKGRLEIKALCMNYTIKVMEGNIDTSLTVASWTDPTTQKPYTNVFALGSPCNFPPTIQAGDEFNFSIDASPVLNCPVCMAYYPTPPKKLSIKVVEK